MTRAFPGNLKSLEIMKLRLETTNNKVVNPREETRS